MVARLCVVLSVFVISGVLGTYRASEIFIGPNCTGQLKVLSALLVTGACTTTSCADVGTGSVRVNCFSSPPDLRNLGLIGKFNRKWFVSLVCSYCFFVFFSFVFSLVFLQVVCIAP